MIPWFSNSTSALHWLRVKHQSWHILGGNSRNSAFTTCLGCHLSCSGAISHPCLWRKAQQSDKTPKAHKVHADLGPTVVPGLFFHGLSSCNCAYKHNSTSITAALTLHLPITSLAMDPAVNSEPQSQEQPYPCKEWKSSGETSVGMFPKQKGKFPSVTADPGLPKLKTF